LYWTFYIIILLAYFLRKTEAQQQLNFLEVVGGKEIGGLKIGGKKVDSKKVGSKEVGGKEVGSKEVSGFLADFAIALL